MRVELVPLPHRPPLATSDTLQVPSNLAGSARAEPDRMTPALSASATTVFLIMGCVPLLNVPVLPGFRSGLGLKLGERDLTHARDADRLGGCFREVDDAPVRIRAAVVDAHHHRLARPLVGDPDLGAEGQGLVRGGQVVGVEPLAIGSLLAVKAGAVPGGCAGLDRLSLFSCSRGGQRAAKEKGSDGQGGRSFGHALRFPLLLRCTIQHIALQQKPSSITGSHAGYAGASCHSVASRLADIPRKLGIYLLR